MQNARVAVLSRSVLDPRMCTVQCDRCRPALIATNLDQVLLGLGWELASHGAARDLCPTCRYHHRPLSIPAATEQSGALPNLLIVGAAKCGTTTLHAWLDEHPDVSMAALKELRFFSDPTHRDWQAAYEAQFDASAPVRGESSTMYTRAPAVPGVPGRMEALVPQARLVYLVRDPVARALASYAEERFHGLEPRSVDEAFDDLEDPYNPYVSASRYAEQLMPFLDVYPREQVVVLTVDQLDREPASTMQKLFEFVGVDPRHPVDTARRHNERSSKYEYAGMAARLRRSRAAELVRRLPGPSRGVVQSSARRLLSRPLPRPELSPALEARLRAALRPDALAFRDLTGLELAEWSV